MAISPDFEFSYFDVPMVFVNVASPITGLNFVALGQIDTGAEITVLDETIAEHLRVDLTDANLIRLEGVGGAINARVVTVELSLLQEPALSVILDVAFAPTGYGIGNLIGLDVFSQVDLSLSHSSRLGYFSIPERT
jgi:hypothetical protein